MAKKILEVWDGGLMAKRKSIPRKPLPPESPRPQSEEMQALQEQVQHLQFEVDVWNLRLKGSHFFSLRPCPIFMQQYSWYAF